MLGVLPPEVHHPLLRGPCTTLPSDPPYSCLILVVDEAHRSRWSCLCVSPSEGPADSCTGRCNQSQLDQLWGTLRDQCGTHQKQRIFIPELLLLLNPITRCQLPFRMWGIIVWHNFGQAPKNIMTNIWGPGLVKRLTGSSSLYSGWGVTFLQAVVYSLCQRWHIAEAFTLIQLSVKCTTLLLKKHLLTVG